MKKLLWLLVPLALLAGCAFFQSQTATDFIGKSEGVAVPAVNAAMMAWSAQVNAGHATQKQVDAVKVAYDEYYNLQIVASNAVTSYAANTNAAAQASLNAALTAALSSQTNIIWLIQSFTTHHP